MLLAKSRHSDLQNTVYKICTYTERQAAAKAILLQTKASVSTISD